jgi:hypothetical protein
MLHVFHFDIVYVAMTIHVCCKCMFQMFQLFQTYVASVFIWMFHTLQVYASNVSVVSTFKGMLQVLCLDVTYVALAIYVLSPYS